MGLVRHWYRLVRVVVDAPSQEQGDRNPSWNSTRMGGKEVPLEVLGTGECQAGEQFCWKEPGAQQEQELVACPGSREGQQPPSCVNESLVTGSAGRALLSQPLCCGIQSGASEQDRHGPTTAGPAKATLVLGGWSTCPVRRGWGIKPFSPWRKKVLLEDLRAAIQHHEVTKNMGPGSPQSCMLRDWEKRGTSWKGRWRLNITNTVSPYNPAVPQVAQRGCAFSFLGNFSRSTCMWPCFEQRVSPRTSWSPSQPGLSYATRSGGEDRGQSYNSKGITFGEVSCTSSMHGFCLLAFYKVKSSWT